MICDYRVIRRQVIKLPELYSLRRDSIYRFSYGYNWSGYVAWVVGFVYLLPGFAHAVNPNIEVPRACTNMYLSLIHI